jgi:hypothetical protein
MRARGQITIPKDRQNGVRLRGTGEANSKDLSVARAVATRRTTFPSSTVRPTSSIFILWLDDLEVSMRFLAIM